jgi:hypothetical protein
MGLLGSPGFPRRAVKAHDGSDPRRNREVPSVRRLKRPASDRSDGRFVEAGADARLDLHPGDLTVGAHGEDDRDDDIVRPRAPSGPLRGGLVFGVRRGYGLSARLARRGRDEEDARSGQKDAACGGLHDHVGAPGELGRLASCGIRRSIDQ